MASLEVLRAGRDELVALCLRVAIIVRDRLGDAGPGSQGTWVAPKDPTEVAPADRDRNVPLRANVELSTELLYSDVLENPLYLIRGLDSPRAGRSIGGSLPGRRGSFLPLLPGDRAALGRRLPDYS